ncbi:histone H1-like isoform X2 [Gadus macrocephalus]|uniref:histone H1-like isoform X2 n=1 Tax=Gadus macrocephalus TaxID=80720 RepID=UPI0028CBB0C6|nr:histone H1-like isoform X2 [Gadus macrocephalus]
MELFVIKKHHSNGCLCLLPYLTVFQTVNSVAACPCCRSFLGVFYIVLIMAGVKSARKVSTNMTKRSRKTVRLTPKAVTENKKKPRKTTPKRSSSPRRRAVSSTRGGGLLKAGPQRNGPLRKPRSTIKRRTNRMKGVSKIALQKTPVRASKARSKARSKASKIAGGGRRLPGLPQLIRRAALQCAQRGGITMAALQHVLANGGYDVSKNNARVRMTLKGLVGKGTLLQRAGSRYKLNTGAGEKKTAVRTTKRARSRRRSGKAIKASKPASKSTPPRKPAKKSPTKVKKQAGRPKGRKPMRSTKAKKPRARKGKTTQRARRSKSC